MRPTYSAMARFINLKINIINSTVMTKKDESKDIH